jgi:hypothetical protein
VTAAFGAATTLTLGMSRVTNFCGDVDPGPFITFGCNPDSSITSSPDGIECHPFANRPPDLFQINSGTCTAKFMFGTTITLTSQLTPTWGGDCAPLSSYATVTGPVCTLALLKPEMNVSAAYQ